MRANERTDERVAQYLRLDSCLFQTTVGRESVESGYGGDDDLASSRGTASSLTGSVSSLLEEPSAVTSTDDQRQAWLDEIAKIDEEAATLRLVLQVGVWVWVCVCAHSV